jgi:hypothetical protein
VIVLAACSGDDDGDDGSFSACGGDPVAGWDLASSALTGSTDMCMGGVSGFIFFNDNGRYSLSVDIKDWKPSPADACGFTAAYGGFYRVDGTKICLGDSSAEGAAIPCDGTRPTTQHAVVDFCVGGAQLHLSSDHFLSARVPTVLTLTRRP